MLTNLCKVGGLWLQLHRLLNAAALDVAFEFLADGIVIFIAEGDLFCKSTSMSPRLFPPHKGCLPEGRTCSFV